MYHQIYLLIVTLESTDQLARLSPLTDHQYGGRMQSMNNKTYYPRQRAGVFTRSSSFNSVFGPLSFGPAAVCGGATSWHFDYPLVSDKPLGIERGFDSRSDTNRLVKLRVHPSPVDSTGGLRRGRYFTSRSWPEELWSDRLTKGSSIMFRNTRCCMIPPIPTRHSDQETP